MLKLLLEPYRELAVPIAVQIRFTRVGAPPTRVPGYYDTGYAVQVKRLYMQGPTPSGTGAVLGSQMHACRQAAFFMRGAWHLNWRAC